MNEEWCQESVIFFYVCDTKLKEAYAIQRMAYMYGTRTGT